MGGLLATELDPAAILDEIADQTPALLGADACVLGEIRISSWMRRMSWLASDEE